MEPDERRRGIGTTLVASAVSWASRHGIATVHLAAETGMAGWYEKRGWHVRDKDVHGLAILTRATGTPRTAVQN